MPTIADLLTPEAREALVVEPVIEPATPTEPSTPQRRREAATDLTRTCACERRTDGFRREGTVLVHKGCGRPRPQVLFLVGANVVPVTLPCAGCDAPTTLAARPAEVEDALTTPRLIVCPTCAGAKTTRNTKAAPVAVTMKEAPVPVSISDISSAQLGESIKQAERERLAADLPAKRKKAKDQEAKREKREKRARAEARQALTDLGVLPGFTLRKIEVPALDASALDGLDEVPDGFARSPYNLVRAALGEDLHPQDDPGAPACTWGDLLTDHQRFALLAAQEPVETTKTKKSKKARKASIAATIDTDEATKIRALRTALGCSKAEARKILASV